MLHHSADGLRHPLQGAVSLSLAHVELQGHIQSPSTLSWCFSISLAALSHNLVRFLALLQPCSLLRCPSPLHWHRPSSAVVGVGVYQRVLPQFPRDKRGFLQPGMGMSVCSEQSWRLGWASDHGPHHTGVNCLGLHIRAWCL